MNIKMKTVKTKTILKIIKIIRPPLKDRYELYAGGELVEVVILGDTAEIYSTKGDPVKLLKEGFRMIN